LPPPEPVKKPDVRINRVKNTKLGDQNLDQNKNQSFFTHSSSSLSEGYRQIPVI